MENPVPPRIDSHAVPPPGAASVTAGNGLDWWTRGWRLFAATPWMWIAITAACVVIMIMLTFIPLLGTVATTLLAPVFAGGVMAGCRAVDRGDALVFNHLFEGFSDRLGPLVVVGVLYLAGTMVIMGLVLAILAATIGITGVGALLAGDPMHAGFAALATIGIGSLLATAVGLLIGLPLMMAYWFAPALVMLRGDEPVAAMKASFAACLANIGPMLVYSVIGLVAAIVASIPVLLGWLVLAPVFAGSVYASYKDLFGAPAPTG